MRSHTGLGPPFTKRSGPHRADAVQAALAQLTGIEQADQILMHGGNRVDGAKTLAQYNLPEVRAFAVWLEQGGMWGEGAMPLCNSSPRGGSSPISSQDPASAQPVFLYSRRLMRPGTPAPPLDPVPETHVQCECCRG